jgi:hypothetical protein
MNNALKLLIPIALGIVAAAVNWFALQEKTAPGVYLKVKEDIRAGQPFTADILDRLEVPGDSGSLRETAVPYRDKAVLYNSPSLRDLKKGDLVLWRDVKPQMVPGEDQLPISLEGISVVHPRLLAVGNEVTFVIDRNGNKTAAPSSSTGGTKSSESRPDLTYIGPFRIVTVDGQVARPEKESRGGERLITLAIRRLGENGVPNPSTTQLLEAIKARKEGRHKFVEMILNAPRKQ